MVDPAVAADVTKLNQQNAQAVLDVAQTEANKGSIVHVFNPDASPEEKAAAAGMAKDKIKSTANGGGQELSIDTGRGAPLPPTITISDVDKQLADAAEKPAPKVSSVPPSPKSAVTDKHSTPGDLPDGPAPAIPDWYVVGWRAASGVDNGPPSEEQAIEHLLGSFLKEQFYGDWYHNAAVIFFAVIASHFITLFRLGWGALLILLAFCATYYSTSIGRVRRRARDDIQRELVKTRLISEHESADWINNFMDRFWKIYEPVLCQTIVSSVDQILSVNTPPFLESLRLTTFTLGSKAPRIDSVRTFPSTADDIVMMDWGISFTPTDVSDLPPRLAKNKTNPKIVLTIRLGKGVASAAIPILVEDISFTGKMRIRMKLMNNFPHVQLVDITFLEKPLIDYVLKPIGGETFGFDIASIPGLSSFIRDMTHGTLGPMMYDPNVFTLNLEQLLSGTPLDVAIGVLQITVHNARGLTSTGIRGGAPDPYVSFSIENRQELARTSYKEDTYNPAWHETKFLLINSLSESLSMSVKDYNEHRKDANMGIATFELGKLKEDANLEDLVAPITKEGKPRGELRFDAAFYPVLKPTKVDGVEQPLPDSNVGIVRLTIHQAKDLDKGSIITGALSPFAKVFLGTSTSHTHVTPRPKNTLSPVWESSTEFLCADRSSSVITIKVIDDRDFLSDPTIGLIRVKLDDLLDAKKEAGKDWWPLSNCKSGRIRLTAEWKPLNMAGSIQGANQYTPPIGVVRLWLNKAVDLKNVEAALGGKSDPYVRVMLHNLVMTRTEVINNNLNPEWNQIVYVPVHSPREVIILECMDYQHLTKDRSLGSVELRVGDLVQESKENKEIPYTSKGRKDLIESFRQDKGNTYKGKLYFQAEFVPGVLLKDIEFDVPKSELSKIVETTKVETGASSSVPTPPVPAVPTSPVSSKSQNGAAEEIELDVETKAEPEYEGAVMTKEELFKHQSGIIVFNLIGGTLAKKARLEVLMDDGYWPVAVTPKSRSVHAKWGMVTEGFVKELDFGQVWLKLDQSEDDDKDDLIAELKIDTKAFLEQCMDEPYRFKMTDVEGRNESFVEIQARYIPADVILEARESINNQGLLRVDLISGHDILAADRSGKSDPYAVFSFNNQKVFKSQTKKKTLNPEWDETFEFTVPSRVGSRFEVELFDWNQIEQSKSLGVGVIDLEDLEPFVGDERSIPLASPRTGAKGEVKVRLLFQPAIIAKTRKNTSTFSTAGRAMTTVGALPLGAGKGLVHGVGNGVGFAGKAVKGVFRMGGREEGVKPVLEVPEASASRTSLELPNTSASRPADYTETGAAFPTTGPPPTAAAVEQTNGQVNEYGQVKITVLAAKDLAAATPGDMVRPYVVIKVGDREFKTKYTGKTLTPEWDESSTFLVGPDSQLTAAVYDHKTIGKDRALGEATIDIWKHVSPAAPAQDVWTELRDGQGLLRLRFEFQRGRRSSNASTATKTGGTSRFTSLRKHTTKTES
ncbi:hypothetical protein M422DRAFT_207610 [Sphaerobolus stellatus SS14]|uniref:Tricalbin n=1 Tax=Sphaerobolus stellatus (strain SS14) TaxID=990650 RepID=A0A0C9W183_SPHS4|nr:hypothetical protein M422DRAFT_207610 [Sphaerobolus stellatus SS14]